MQSRHEVLRQFALSLDSFSDALVAGSSYGRLNWLSFNDIYADDAFEQEFYEKFSRDSELEPVRPRVKWLHVVSEIYDLGGHTQLMKTLLDEGRTRSETQHVACTRRSTPDFEGFCAIRDIGFSLLKGSFEDTYNEVLKLGREAEVVVLHIHPDDLVSALAARKLSELGHRVLFVNHADHTFSFGTGPTGTVLEISGYGASVTRGHRAFAKSSFLGIPIQTSHSQGALQPDPKNPIISVGSSAKFRPRGALDFPSFLSALLEQVENDVVLVGPDPQEPWWDALTDAQRKRVEFTGYMSRHDLNGLLENMSCYVDSFPTTGGTIFSEALASGLPVFGLRSVAGGYGHADALRYDSPQEIVQAIAAYTNTGLIDAKVSEIRSKLLQDLCPSAVFDRLLIAASGDTVDVPDELARFDRGSKINDAIALSADTPTEIGIYFLRQFSPSVKFQLLLAFFLRLKPRGEFMDFREATKLMLGTVASNTVGKAMRLMRGAF